MPTATKRPVAMIFRLLQDVNDLRIILHAISERVYIQLAEAAPEGDVLFRRNALITEENDLMIKKCLMHRVKFTVTQGLAQINTMDLGT